MFACPRQHRVVVLVLRVANRFEEVSVAIDATNIFWWTASFARQAGGR